MRDHFQILFNEFGLVQRLLRACSWPLLSHPHSPAFTRWSPSLAALGSLDFRFTIGRITTFGSYVVILDEEEISGTRYKLFIRNMKCVLCHFFMITYLVVIIFLNIPVDIFVRIIIRLTFRLKFNRLPRRCFSPRSGDGNQILFLLGGGTLLGFAAFGLARGLSDIKSDQFGLGRGERPLGFDGCRFAIRGGGALILAR